MKVLFVLSALAAVALANPGVISPLAYSAGYAGYPYGYNTLGYSATPYTNLGYSNLGYSNLGYSNLGYSNLGYSNLGYAAAPIAHAALAVPSVTKTQYHSQDELGQASYGYAHAGQTHNAVQDAAGNVAGSYSYVDPNGKIVKTDYIADGAGFRVASNALPVAPAVPIVAAVELPVGPAPVQDTAEVVAARHAHLAEVAAVKSRSKRGVVAYGAAPLAYAAQSYGFAAPALSTYGAYAASPLAYGAYGASPLAYGAYGASPLAYAAAPAVHATRAATLTTVVNTPGHAVSYRVD